MNNYILDKDKNPVVCNDLILFAEFMSNYSNKVVCNTQIDALNTRVSTVFLGIDHGFNGSLILFETMIFGGEHDESCSRYSTWAEAEAGHKKWVEKVCAVKQLENKNNDKQSNGNIRKLN